MQSSGNVLKHSFGIFVFDLTAEYSRLYYAAFQIMHISFILFKC